MNITSEFEKADFFLDERSEWFLFFFFAITALMTVSNLASFHCVCPSPAWRESEEISESFPYSLYREAACTNQNDYDENEA